MYVATQVETYGMIAQSYACKRCGHRAQARVVVTGQAETTGYGVMAGEVARELAKRDGDMLAARSLMFVPCPSCEQVDPSAASYRRTRTLFAIAVALAFIAVGVVMALWMESPADVLCLLMLGTFGVITGVRTYLRQRRPWARVEYRVSFERADAAHAAG
jgi:hypothetical protein